MVQSFDKIISRASMYLGSHDRRLHAGSICQNLLDAVMYDDSEFGLPDYVEFTAAGPYFVATAVGCWLNSEVDEVSWRTSLLDWQQPLPSTIPNTLVYFQPIVWFTQYCLVDFTIGQITHRQIFQNAQPLGEAVRFPANEGIGPRISFCFTIPSPSPVFESNVLDQASLKRCLSLWQKWHQTQAWRYQFPKLRYTWRTLSTYSYTVRIAPITEGSVPVPPS